MQVGTCKLCLKKQSLLQKSHLVPRAVYSLCRATQAPNPNPLMVTHKLAMQTSRQTKAHLLCFKCEQLLRERGEDWVLPRLARFRGPFPLGEALEAMTKAVDDTGLAAYTLAGSTNVRPSELTHFAMGVFWKAGVHSWVGKTRKPWMNLGARRADCVRRYLLGETSFPSEMALQLTVLPMPAAVTYFHLPFELAPTPGHTTFHFYVHGLNYMLWVGSDIPYPASQVCLSATPNVVLVFDCSNQIIQRFRSPSKRS